MRRNGRIIQRLTEGVTSSSVGDGNGKGGDTRTARVQRQGTVMASVSVPPLAAAVSSPVMEDGASASWRLMAAAAALALTGGAVIKRVFDRPSRTYQSGDSVGQAYDDWTKEGVLEYYWGDHIHLGYYTYVPDRAAHFDARGSV